VHRIFNADRHPSHARTAIVADANSDRRRLLSQTTYRDTLIAEQDNSMSHARYPLCALSLFAVAAIVRTIGQTCASAGEKLSAVRAKGVQLYSRIVKGATRHGL